MYAAQSTQSKPEASARVSPSAILAYASGYDAPGRVERWRGGLRLRFHLPLIEPDVRISRIRLSDKEDWVIPIMLSPTGGCEFVSRAALVREFRRDSCPGSV